MHYAVLPIYYPEDASPVYEQVSYKGFNVLVCKTEEGLVLERVYSTNPLDFVNPDLLPGTLLNESFINKTVQ